MAVLYITEYATAGRDIAGKPWQVPQEPPVAEQVVAIGGASVQSAAFNVKTTLVRLHVDVTGPASVLFGANPTALTTSGRMAANTTEYVAIDRSSVGVAALKVAVISNT